MEEFLFRKGGLNMKVKDLSISSNVYIAYDEKIKIN